VRGGKQVSRSTERRYKNQGSCHMSWRATVHTTTAPRSCCSLLSSGKNLQAAYKISHQIYIYNKLGVHFSDSTKTCKIIKSVKFLI
jgi:hypothetical protein